MTSLLETHVEMGLSSYFYNTITKWPLISITNSLQITDIKFTGLQFSDLFLEPLLK